MSVFCYIECELPRGVGSIIFWDSGPLKFIIRPCLIPPRAFSSPQFSELTHEVSHKSGVQTRGREMWSISYSVKCPSDCALFCSASGWATQFTPRHAQWPGVRWWQWVPLAFRANLWGQGGPLDHWVIYFTWGSFSRNAEVYCFSASGLDSYPIFYCSYRKQR